MFSSTSRQSEQSRTSSPVQSSASSLVIGVLLTSRVLKVSQPATFTSSRFSQPEASIVSTLLPVSVRIFSPVLPETSTLLTAELPRRSTVSRLTASFKSRRSRFVNSSSPVKSLTFEFTFSVLTAAFCSGVMLRTMSARLIVPVPEPPGSSVLMLSGGLGTTSGGMSSDLGTMSGDMSSDLGTGSGGFGTVSTVMLMSFLPVAIIAGTSPETFTKAVNFTAVLSIEDSGVPLSANS